MKCTKCSKDAVQGMVVQDTPDDKPKKKDKEAYIYGFCQQHWDQLMRWMNA